MLIEPGIANEEISQPLGREGSNWNAIYLARASEKDAEHEAGFARKGKLVIRSLADP